MEKAVDEEKIDNREADARVPKKEENLNKLFHKVN